MRRLDITAIADARDEIEVTDKMQEAGSRLLSSYVVDLADGFICCQEVAASVYRAMHCASLPTET
jgi:hypothetical protein